MSRRIKVFVRIFITLSAAFAPLTQLLSAPARHYARTFFQPDGTSIKLRLAGDEHFSVLLTTDGVPVAPAQDGSYRYITDYAGNGPVLSDILAHDPGSRTIREAAMARTIAETPLPASSPKEEKILKGDRTRHADIIAEPGEYSTNGFPTTGTAKGLVILAEFPDKQFSLPDDDIYRCFDEMLNKEGYTNSYTYKDYTYNGAIGSVKDYFKDQSYGLFTPEFTVAGPIMADSSYVYYGHNVGSSGDDSQGTRKLVEEMVQKIYMNNLADLTQFDANSDGTVDFVYVIYAGNAENYAGSDPNTIWPHQSSVYKKLGRMYIKQYACSSELFYDSEETIDGIGTICHEFSHILGLPDFYPTNGEEIFAMSSWSVMDYGVYNNNGYVPCGYTALERFSLGWMDLTGLDGSGRFTLPDLSTKSLAYRLNTDNVNQFLILENHPKTGWYMYQESEGLMITAVYYSKTAWVNNTVNNDEKCKRYYIICADNDPSEEWVSLAGDLYPWNGKDSLTLYSEPAAVINAGSAVNLPIYDIGFVNNTVSFTLGSATNGLNELFINSPRISGGKGNGTVTVHGVSGPIMVYSITGKLLMTVFTDESGSCTFRKPADGLILVKTARKTFKIY